MHFIVACDSQWAIGRDNALLDHFKEDMAFFKRTTTAHVVVMGRRTLESFPGGRPLKDRVNIVLSRQMDYCPQGVIVAAGIPELKTILKELGRQDVYVIGGMSIYRQLLPYCSQGFVTHIDHVYDNCDAYFPDLDAEANWHCTQVVQKGQEHGIGFSMCLYENEKTKALEE